MSSYRPIDSKREEFRKYLEKAGAMDALTKVLVMLYDEPEKPADALDYIRKHLGDTRPDEKEIEIMKADLEASAIRIQTLEDEINVLKGKLEKYEPLEDKIPMDEENFPPDTSEEPPLSNSPIDAVASDQPRTKTLETRTKTLETRTGTLEDIPPTE